MKNWRQWVASRSFGCALWVALCFGLTSAVYLSWLNRMVALAGGAAADWLSMGAGYLFQAAGMGLVCLLLRRRPGADMKRFFTLSTLLFALISTPALLTDSVTGVICFGLLMNLLCGVIAGLYLFAVGQNVAADRRGVVFGGGYALATVGVGLLALIGRGSLLHGRYALLIHIPFALLALLTAFRLGLFDAGEEAPAPAQGAEGKTEGCLALACATVVMLSAVKNMGFGFPSADIEAGLIPELSRLPYAIGLAVAGWISDRDRKNGMLCTLAALILPFIMLGLTNEIVSSTICWGLDYLFFGFFSVFRVVLFLDIAARTRRWELAPLGLLMGRIGDAAGTGAGILLSGSKLALILVTAALFFPTVYLCFCLYRRLYEPEVVQQRSEQEIFEAFCLHNDLSPREREVLRMVIDNRSNGEIAEALFITESTVKYHVRNVLQKAGCKNRNELQRKYTLALYPQLKTTVLQLMPTQEDAG
ncbi:MAG: hypothetical protein IJ124_14985 [Clostridia bacterium]|nr:hypothetical protein [Clostridia bacterium]